MTDLFNNPLGPVLVERKSKPARTGQQLQIAPEIKSIAFDQVEILNSILTLFVSGQTFDCDATYGYGEFYKEIARPEHCFDIDPKKPEATRGDSRNLPLPSSSIKSLMFDPPFVVSNPKTGSEAIMARKYGGYKNITDLRAHYKNSLDEFARVLRPRGILVFKCQDFAHGRSNYFIHDEIMSMARESGFKAVDLFILLAKNRAKGAWDHQNCARKFHSYFWVFRKMQKTRSGSGVKS
ncbi:hypothetical protein [Spirosoma spitsbergense]|uniref:hypothetical protein n=1 Tax=Spirosoma spitsbergense TaxID=431554 RepID=UPI0003724B7B|nr:hypothetical protein [Spirosoma spitsbergense]